jgi:hypothetical protein
MNSFKKIEIIIIFIIYYNIVIWVVKLFRVYDNSQHVNFILSQNFICYFEEYIIEKLTLG